MTREQLQAYIPQDVQLTKYMFFTGKGGVGKTSLACATAVALADNGKKVLLISTDPASNLQDVFNTFIDNKGVPIKEIPNLSVINLNPEEAAGAYRESIIGPYRGKIPAMMIKNMEEQLSGSCTVEIAAFNEFSEVITSKEKSETYDYILFDTAPTGHTLRMLELPSAWDHYISNENPSENYMGQLSGMKEKQELYKEAVKRLSDPTQTTLVLVSRPDDTPLKEVARSSQELWDIQIKNQWFIINGLMEKPDSEDLSENEYYNKQSLALENAPDILNHQKSFFVPLRSYNMTGIENLRNLLIKDHLESYSEFKKETHYKSLKVLVDELYESNKKVIFTMGKGGVGKTTMAATLALGLVGKGKKVHLTTTDPADHLKYIIDEREGLRITNINPEKELENYTSDIIFKARSQGKTEAEIAYVTEDLQSPCTKEIAVFRAFADMVADADEEIVIIDTAPTGHTLLLLDSTQSYHKEVERSQGDIPQSVRNLLPRLRDTQETEVLIVTLPEATPVLEAERLKSDLSRAGIDNTWWIVNNSMSNTNTKSPLLQARAHGEQKWMEKVDELTDGKKVVVSWTPQELKGENLKILLNNN
ncbi:arsenical pump-driving ATPase [Chryseobacterium sp. JK1]|uniref:arsenical pump-driving ATPase n=1 Tax=Chryseobacterium sp. JK1 TaxID=874294 RepID=UPI003D68ECF6